MAKLLGAAVRVQQLPYLQPLSDGELQRVYVARDTSRCRGDNELHGMILAHQSFFHFAGDSNFTSEFTKSTGSTWICPVPARSLRWSSVIQVLRAAW